jgi:hypothetical protein
MKKPILFLIFNRPDTTEKVFEAIREYKPKQFFVAADGPRESKENEEKLCKKTRDIISAVDWDCEVKTLFRDENLGCKEAVSSAITWFFDHVEDGIILEDDCLPAPSFFDFCAELLDKYQNDERIMMISGFNKQGKWLENKNDYFFSNLGGIWGWASWKRAWKHYDADMKYLEFLINNKYLEFLFGKKTGRIRASDLLRAPKNTWDFSWGYSRHLNNGLSCVPSKNLIRNIGFDKNGTHTKRKITQKNINLYDLEPPLKNNKIIIADSRYDYLFLKKSLLRKIWEKIK